MYKIKLHLLLLIALLVSVAANAQTASGPSVLCTGTSNTYVGTPAGGSWSSSSSAVAPINPTTGVATGVAAGIATITYMLPSSAFATITVTVSLAPSPGTLSGSPTVCDGSTTVWTSTVSGGTWSSSAPAVAMVSSTGVITGIVPGTATISYAVIGSGCSASATGVVTVVSSPTIIGGSAGACVGATITHAVSPSGGAWTASPMSVGTISGTGVVTGVSPGTVYVTYALPSGCFATVADYISPAPSAITGPGSVCAGSTITLANSVTGGTWVSTAVACAWITTSTGVVTGASSGTTIISYITGPGCAASTVVTVTAGATISAGGPLSFCVGGGVTLSETPSGGVWSSVGSSASVSSGGVVSGIAAGVETITYSAGSCSTTVLATVMPNPSAISGSASVCAGSAATFTCSTAGGTWSSSNPSVGTIDVMTGVATGIAAGTTTITYTIATGCYTTATLTVYSVPSVTASAVPASCGNTYTLTGSGAASYVWMSPAGLSCMSCTSPVATVTSTTTYTVTGTTSGCSGTATITVSGDRIYGHVTFSSTVPSSPSVKVWLVQYDATDSSIIATDSIVSCYDGGSEYYSFDGKPAGSYLVKAKLISAVAGTSDYIPTYGASTPNWYSAVSITHAGATDVQDINMIYGTVPSGPGFISGYVYSGAGKGTAGDAPAVGMLVFLRNITGQVLTYTYTAADGSYTFGSLSYGSYIVYPEESSFYTTPSATIVLSATTPGESAATFKQYTTSRVILPYTAPTSIFTVTSSWVNTGVYPNPTTGIVYIQHDGQEPGTAHVSLTDMTGRSVLSTTIEIDNKGTGRLDVSGIGAGMYILQITSDHLNYTGKLTKQE